MNSAPSILSLKEATKMLKATVIKTARRGPINIAINIEAIAVGIT